MIRLTFTVDDISTVIQVYNRIEIRRSLTENGTYADVVGLGPVYLSPGTSNYTIDDPGGTATDWYISRYHSTSSGLSSSWSQPVLGSNGVLFYNPLYPDEEVYSTSQKSVISKVRRLIGDPVRLKHDYGPDYLSNVHLDGKTYELQNTGWPASVHMGGVCYNSIVDPSVNGYKYLRFSEYIGDITDDYVTYSGTSGALTKHVPNGIDVWYYTFRNSDRQIMEAYDSSPIPYPLNESTVTTEVYILQTAIELLEQELLEDSTEDGAYIRDEGSHYNPEPGLKIRQKLLDELRGKLNALVKSLSIYKPTGIRIE